MPMALLPMQTGSEQVVPETKAAPRPEEMNLPQLDRSVEETEREAADKNLSVDEHGDDRREPVEGVPADDSSERARWQEAVAVRYREML